VEDGVDAVVAEAQLGGEMLAAAMLNYQKTGVALE
jgi:hypothetical protein